MKSLITGGCGFIGSHLAEKLLAEGHEVFIIDNLSTGRLENIRDINNHQDIHVVIDSILKESCIRELICRVDNIYHLAGVVGVRNIMEKPIETLETNVRGTEIILKYADMFKKKVLITSTSEVYGLSNSPLSENDDRIMGSVKKRRWAYACSKELDEFLALAYFDERKLPIVIARLFNTVGPRQTGEYGMVLPRFVESALKNEPIKIYGNGSQTRSFCHVKDVVNALVMLMEKQEGEGEIFNVGNDEEVTIEYLAYKIKEMTNSKSTIQHFFEPYGDGFEDMKQRCPNLNKINNLIGYTSKYFLEGIIQDVIDYISREKAYKNLSDRINQEIRKRLGDEAFEKLTEMEREELRRDYEQS